MRERTVRRFESNSPEYERAFQTFLSHTDQKEKAFAWLVREVEALADRAVMIDAGAGNGMLTARLQSYFNRVTAIEPNASLAAQLLIACPAVHLIRTTIAMALPPEPGTFVLCSHVFYHVPELEWESTLRHMMSWLNPGGVLAIALQNPRTDCMRMVDHFLSGPLDLSRLVSAAADESNGFKARLETVPAQVRTADLTTACEVAEFMLNSTPIPPRPSWNELERYVKEHFAQADGGFQFSCDQDFLRVSKAA
jgi:trans-aconitate methyltransferase